MIKNMKKSIAAFLVVTVFATILPTRIYAATENTETEITSTINETPSEEQVGENTEVEKEETPILEEIVEKREANVKHFEKEDHSFEISVYPEPVHYLKDGKWEDIDNTLKESLNKESKNEVLKNTSNDISVEFSKRANSNNLVKISKNKYSLSWGYEGALASTVKADKEKQEKNIDKTIDDTVSKIIEKKKIKSSKKKRKQQEIIKENEEKKALSSLESSVIYPEIDKNIDLEYKLIGSKVKENILLKEKTDKETITFNLNTKNLIPKIKENNSIEFYADDTNSLIYTIPAPFMLDATGEQSIDIKISLEKKSDKDNYVLIMTPSKKWLNDENRKYPVTIDPVATTPQSVRTIQDNMICSRADLAGNNYRDANLLRVGTGTANGEARSLIKFDNIFKLDGGVELETSDMITKANLNLYTYPYISDLPTGKIQVNVHKIASDWNTSTVCWNNAPSFDPKVEDYQFVDGTTWSQWDVTGVVKEWFSTGVNRGLLLKAEGSPGVYQEFLSSDCDISFQGQRPILDISYINNNGLEDYWTYHSQSIGRSGTGYVNDYNGNLIYVHDDISTTGNRLPMGISHIYNEHDRNNNIVFGYGWRINLQQTLLYKTIGSKNYYVHTDGDGTKHYYLIEGTQPYKEEINTDFKLTKNADSTYIIEDKENNKLKFDAGGKLTNLIDKNGNTQTITYSGTNISTVTDGSGRVASFHYVNGMLSTIKINDPNSDGGVKVYGYNYDNLRLSQITYNDGENTYITYDSQNKITSVKGIDGYTVNYQYYTQKPYRVKKVSEANGSATGSYLDITYGYNTTIYKDAKGRKHSVQFDDSGKTISSKDAQGNGQYYEYDTDITNSTNLAATSKVQGNVINLLKNHNFEYESAEWNKFTSSSGTKALTTEYSYMGNKSMKLTNNLNTGYSGFEQYPTLKRGKTYTVSAYFKGVNLSKEQSDSGIKLAVYYKNSGGSYLPRVVSEALNGTFDWKRVKITFTVPADALDGTIVIRPIIEAATGTAYVDCMQLEEGNLTNRYNLLENGDLEGSGAVPDKWAGYGLTTSDTLITTTDIEHPAPLSDKVFKVTGSAATKKDIVQKVYGKIKKGDTFIATAWARGQTAASGTVTITLGFVSGTNTKYVSKSFNKDTYDWQYLSSVFQADGDYDSLNYYLEYNYNANTMSFDGAQLFKEEFGTTYQYDDKGNLTSTVDLEKKKETFEYDTNNNLVKATNVDGAEFKYKYDAKHNVTEATNASNVTYSFTYDNYGNPTKSTVGTSTLFMSSTATYTSDGNYLSSLKDSSGNTVSYVYNKSNGNLEQETDPKGKITTYTYDKLGRILSANKNANGTTVNNNYTYTKDKLTKVTHNDFDYNFSYDTFGRVSKVDVGGTKTLITNKYDNLTGNLLSATYGNNQTVSTVYDSFDRVKEKKFGAELRYSYEYGSEGNLARLKDEVNDKTYDYTYDTIGRLAEIKDNGNNSTSYSYDIKNNVSSIKDKINGQTFTTNYLYDKDNKPTEVNYNRVQTTGLFENYSLNGNGIGSNGNTPVFNYSDKTIKAKATIANITSESYTVQVSILSNSIPIARIEFPTWTTANGQDDITKDKITGNSSTGTTLNYTYVVKRYKHNNEYGSYNTHVYIYDQLGNLIIIPLQTTLNTSPIAGTITIENVTTMGYDAVLKLSSIPNGVSSVDFAAWSDTNGQDDLKWTPVAGNGTDTYRCRINRNEHNTFYGAYTTHVYVTDTKGTKTLIGGASSKLTATDFNITASLVSQDNYGYTIKVNVIQGNYGLKELRIASWTDANGQTDTKWDTITSTEASTYTYRVNKSDHNNEYGAYTTHVYGYDIFGSSVIAPVTVTLSYKPFTVTSKVSNITPTGYDIIATVSGGQTPNGKIKFPTWSLKGGQDDITWEEMTLNHLGVYVYHVDRKNHFNEFGSYRTDVYLYDASGKALANCVTPVDFPASQDGLVIGQDSGKTYFNPKTNIRTLYKPGVLNDCGTISVKFKTTATTGRRVIFSVEDSKVQGISVYIDTDNKLKISVNGVPGTKIALTSPEIIAANTWYFTALAWDYTNGKLNLRLFINGTKYSALTTDCPDFTGAYVVLGADILGLNSLTGFMEQFNFSTQALSDTDITSKLNNTTSSTTKTYSYDTLSRLTQTNIKTTGTDFTTTYQYEKGIETGSTTTRISSINNDGKEIKYTYDKNGNIETILEGGKTIKYYYNELNELIREDNQVLNSTITYSYDKGGNITSKIEYPYSTGALGTAKDTYSYGYDGTWKDLMTSFDGKAITYDNIGNPLTYNGYKYTWEMGRQLAGISGNGLAISYKYNDDGIRTEKAVKNTTTNAVVTTKYVFDGNKVIYEETDHDKIYYTYTHGSLVSMNLNGIEYYYIKNIQNDIIGLFDNNGLQVASYVYDSWGKLVNIKDQNGVDVTNNKDHVGYRNPYRYRSYRYDTETELYYLNSRYYNPEYGRFVNEDSFIGINGLLLSHNLFTYCGNNPINHTDSTGYFLDEILDVGSIVVDIVLIVIDPVDSTNWLALGADIGCVLLPGATGGGAAVRGLSHADEAVDTVKAIDEGIGVVRGGRFADVTATKGIDEVGHHMAQNAYNKTIGISRSDGPALLMKKEDHSLTRSFAGKGKSSMIEDTGLTTRQRLAKDIMDIRKNFGSKYNKGMLQMLEYSKTLPQYSKR